LRSCTTSPTCGSLLRRCPADQTDPSITNAGRGRRALIRSRRERWRAEGASACRLVAFEVADRFVEAYNCHCSNCRAATGSVFRPWGEIEPDKMRLTQGADSLVVQGDPDRHAVRCNECFSLLHWTGHEGKIRIPYGTLIDEPGLKPMAHIFVGCKASWYEILDELPQYDESPWGA
jgi:hypothetical protein